jgi:glycosidase
MKEFEALIARTHAQDMQVIIDIVPNHVSRHYEGKNNPSGVQDFGAGDNKAVAYHKDNNFYYIPGESFQVPAPKNGYQPLGGEKHPLANGEFQEDPAKWTGNGSRKAQPDFYDWYETVKINYGVSPEGNKEFAELPADAANLDWSTHYAFWQGKSVPDSWKKFKDITQFWLSKGVDGFRFDMAEMVPVEFWSYLNSHIKKTNPDAFLLAEVYTPSLYRAEAHHARTWLYGQFGAYPARLVGHRAPHVALPRKPRRAADCKSRVCWQPLEGSAGNGGFGYEHYRTDDDLLWTGSG